MSYVARYFCSNEVTLKHLQNKKKFPAVPCFSDVKYDKKIIVVKLYQQLVCDSLLNVFVEILNKVDSSIQMFNLDGVKYIKLNIGKRGYTLFLLSLIRLIFEDQSAPAGGEDIIPRLVDLYKKNPKSDVIILIILSYYLEYNSVKNQGHAAVPCVINKFPTVKAIKEYTGYSVSNIFYDSNEEIILDTHQKRLRKKQIYEKFKVEI